eukprot:s250_g15.t1
MEEGKEYSHEDYAEWEQLKILSGQIVEAEIGGINEDYPDDVWAGFLVLQVEFGLEGDLILHCKSLGCDDPESTRRLSSAFNRRQGRVHLCHSYPCEVEGDFTVHCNRLKLYSPEGFARDYVTAAMKKQMKKWLEQEEEETGEVPLGSGPKAGEEEEKEVERTSFVRPAPKAGATAGPPKGADKIGDAKREELRRRLETAKAKMHRGGSEGAGLGAVLPPFPPSPPGDPGYSPSLLDEEEMMKRTMLELDDAARKAEEKLPPDHTKDQKEAARSSRRDKKRRSEDSKREEKENAKKKDPGALLLKLLSQNSGGKKKKKRGKRDKDGQDKKGSKKDKKERKKKRQKGGGGPDSSPSSSSGSGQTSSSGNDSDKELDSSSSSSEDLRLEPPLRKRAREKPGSVLQLLVDHARNQLDQSAKVTVGKDEEKNYTTGVKLASYFAIVIRPQVRTINPQVREMHLLSTCMDALRQGQLDHVGDLLAPRFISLHQSLLDGNWVAARQLELLPLEEVSAAGAQLVLQARKQAKLAAKVNYADSWTPQGAGKGRGGRGKGGSWGEWPQESKGKSRKETKEKERTEDGGGREMPTIKNQTPPRRRREQEKSESTAGGPIEGF